VTVLFCQSDPKCQEILCYVRPDTPDKHAAELGWKHKANGWNCRTHAGLSMAQIANPAPHPLQGIADAWARSQGKS
jgi:hypothetical protein